MANPRNCKFWNGLGDTGLALCTSPRMTLRIRDRQPFPESHCLTCGLVNVDAPPDEPPPPAAKPRLSIDDLARIKRCQEAKAAGEECHEFDPVPGGAIAVGFRHGIGDATNFAHMIPLYARRGFAIAVHAGHADHAPIFRAGGARVVGHAGATHRWAEPPKAAFGPWADPWPHNKNGWNLSRAPLPFIGDPWALWDEYCAVKLDFGPQVTDADRAAVDLLLQGAPRPYIAMHVKGFAWNNGAGALRNYSDQRTTELQRRLLEATPGTVVMIDRDRQAAHLNSARVVHFRDFGVGHLYELLYRADLLIGIDSGPLNFVRFTDTPAVGIWNNHYPSDFFLPRENTVHVVAAHHAERDKYERGRWNTILAPDDGPSPDVLAQTALRALAGPKLLPRGAVARDVQFQHYADLIDRPQHGREHGTEFLGNQHRGMGRALAFLTTRDRPVVVETGTIRHQEDWAGAGFSTYLFAAYLARHGGELHSADLTPAFVEFARSWTKEFGSATIHQAHSHAFLEEWAGQPIDLFYADSADVGTAGYQECCLGEVERVQRSLAPGARILIDDTTHRDGHWQGKGALAVPWLLAQGWQVEFSGWQVLLARPES